jgi:hypothetical protein
MSNRKEANTHTMKPYKARRDGIAFTEPSISAHPEWEGN